MLCLLLFMSYSVFVLLFFFFFNDTATTEIYTLSLHDALPISFRGRRWRRACRRSPASDGSRARRGSTRAGEPSEDRKSTRLNSSHITISYAVFCLKKKKKNTKHTKQNQQTKTT